MTKSELATAMTTRGRKPLTKTAPVIEAPPSWQEELTDVLAQAGFNLAHVVDTDDFFLLCVGPFLQAYFGYTPNQPRKWWVANNPAGKGSMWGETPAEVVAHIIKATGEALNSLSFATAPELVESIEEQMSASFERQ